MKFLDKLMGRNKATDEQNAELKRRAEKSRAALAKLSELEAR